MIEAFVLGVPFAAAMVYLLVEVFELNVWWRRRREPEPPPVRPPGIGETWPESRRVEAAEEWERALERDLSSNGHKD